MRRYWSCCLSVLFCLLAAVPGRAQIAPQEASGEKNYVMCYFLVGLAVALALIIICRPSRRRKEVRHPDA